MWKYSYFKFTYPACCLIVAGIAFITGYFYWWLIVLFVFIWLLYITIGAFNLSSGIFLNAVTSANTDTNTIMLTFDDGPDPVITPQVLALLKEFDAKAVFFCIGKKMQLYPELVSAIVAEGHILANHTFNHSNAVGFASTQTVIDELEQTEKLIVQHTHRSYKLFRPPFGVTNPNIAKAVQLLGYKVVGWNVRSFDTVSRNEEAVLKRISENLLPGAIVLFHDTAAITPSVLKEFMLLVRKKGFNFNIHSELLIP